MILLYNELIKRIIKWVIMAIIIPTIKLTMRWIQTSIIESIKMYNDKKKKKKKKKNKLKYICQIANRIIFIITTTKVSKETTAIYILLNES